MHKDIILNKNNKKSAKTRRRRLTNKSSVKKCVYTRKHYESNDGMLTTVWGPGTWHFLHTMGFNYPMMPTCDDKRHYRDFILSLQYVLPCGKCRKNIRKNFIKLPLKWSHMKTRKTFSKYLYDLHEVVNTMLDKKSGLSYNDVRERYEHFRARCTEPPIKETQDTQYTQDKQNAKKTIENGCTEPIFGEKSKCVLQIIPQDTKCDTFQIDKKCIKTFLSDAEQKDINNVA